MFKLSEQGDMGHECHVSGCVISCITCVLLLACYSLPLPLFAMLEGWTAEHLECCCVSDVHVSTAEA
jgi:hypothetical protein